MLHIAAYVNSESLQTLLTCWYLLRFDVVSEILVRSALHLESLRSSSAAQVDISSRTKSNG